MKKIYDSLKETDNGCLEWTRSCNSAGYGQTTICKKYWLVHRLVYTLKHGDIPDGMVIRHTCHNTKCCNIEHLILGNHQENWKDSELRHRKVHESRRKSVIIVGITYNSVREANKMTGITFDSLKKYVNDDGFFDHHSYREACKVANKVPKV